MNRFFKIYPSLVLLAATHFLPLPQSAIALVLLLSGLYFHLRKLPQWGIPVTLAYFFAIPLLFESMAPMFLPVLTLSVAPFMTTTPLFPLVLAIPVLPLMNSSFRDNALNQDSACPVKQRQLTFTSKAVMVAMGVTIAGSFLLGNWGLVLAGGMALLFVISMLIYVLRRLPTVLFEVKQEEARILSGDRAKFAIKYTSKAKIPLHISVSSSYRWIHISRSKALNLSGDAELELTLIPSLSGPSEPEIELLCTDPWGLIQLRQKIRPVKLYVIPRAKYAEWLAQKYLEETAAGAGTGSSTFSILAEGIMPKRGVEYYGSRLFQPGDILRDVDWKHTAKLGKFVVKEYVEQARQAAMIAVNLTAANAEEADRLIYNFITSGLTLAKENIPTAIAAYNQKQVIEATALLDSRELVKKTLQLGQKVILVTPLKRYIQPPDIEKLRISMRQLKGTDVEAVGKLREIFELEIKAIEEGARKHPAREALTRVMHHTLPEAMIIMISLWNHDNEALALTLDELRRKGTDAIVMDIKNKSEKRKSR